MAQYISSLLWILRKTLMILDLEFGAVYSSANIERLKISLIKSVIFLPIIFVPV